MASKRNVRRKACGDKRRFASEDEATATASHLRRKDRTLLLAYKCPFCRQWHVGHPNARQRQGYWAKKKS